MTILAGIALVAFVGAVGTYVLVLGLFPPVRPGERVADVLKHSDHMRIRSRYTEQQWTDWTGRE